MFMCVHRYAFMAACTNIYPLPLTIGLAALGIGVCNRFGLEAQSLPSFMGSCVGFDVKCKAAAQGSRMLVDAGCFLFCRSSLARVCASAYVKVGD